MAASIQAVNQLSRLLGAVEHGGRFTITVRGKPVAALRSFPRIRGVRDADVVSFVGEGRR